VNFAGGKGNPFFVLLASRDDVARFGVLADLIRLAQFFPAGFELGLPE
jgi:hypothetical protein